MIFFNNIKLYSTSINGSVDMQCRAITQSSICRSEPTVVDDNTPLLLIESGLNEEKGKTLPHSNLSCEAVQSQKILEEASALLDPFKKRLERASRSVQKAFTLEKLAAAMTKYDNVIGSVEQTKPLNNLYKILCNPCFLLVAYQNVRKEAAAGINRTEKRYFSNLRGNKNSSG